MGGAPHDADQGSSGDGRLSEATIAERQKEGGGGASQRPSRALASRSVRPAAFAAIFLLAASAQAADLGLYREFRLGTPIADVIARTGSAERDVKTLHERPALLQELSWRLPYVSPQAPLADRGAVASVVFSFIDNQLFKMAVEYDRSRTEGLTKDDLIAALSDLYGPRSTRPAPAAARSQSDSLDSQTILARWMDAGTVVALQQSAYGGGFGLVITSVPLEARARHAQVTAATLDARDAPAREAARAKAEADAARAAAEKTRTANKSTFKP